LRKKYLVTNLVQHTKYITAHMQKYQIILYRLLIYIIPAIAFMVEKKGHLNVLIEKNPNTKMRKMRA